jgi:sn-glycerol 3-phosphate transport system substrate-binding protein
VVVSFVMKRLLVFFFMVLCSLAVWSQPFVAHHSRIELVFWHAMAGHLGDEVQELADAFNRSQKKYFIQPVYKGDYKETLTSFAAAFRARHAPDMVQIFEVGTALMLAPKGVIKPVDTLMREQGMMLPKDDFTPSIRAFYSEHGQLMGMPFNLSVPLLYYNKDALAKVGYHAANIPKTWSEFEQLAAVLTASGFDCAYTSAYPGWILVESYIAIHRLPVVSNHPLRMAFDSPQLKHHFNRLSRWQKLHYFRYGGRADDATVLFSSGVCPLFSQSSGAYNSLSSLVPFHLGVTIMPIDTKASTIRHANSAGGAAIWAVGGMPDSHYKGIAQFFAFIAQPNIQKSWHEHTGYLPIGFQGIYAPLTQASRHPILSLAEADLQEKSSLHSFVRHIGPQNQMRTANDEALEALFSGLMSAEEAVNQAVFRSNHALSRFIRNTKEYV